MSSESRSTNSLEKSSRLRRLLSKPTIILVAIFSVADLVAGFFHWLRTEGVLKSRFFNLARDLGFGEIVQYCKLGIIIYILRLWYPRRKEPVIKAWTILFVFLLLDDALGMHEFIGKLVLKVWDLKEMFGVAPKELGEIIGFAVVEGVALMYVFFKVLTAPSDLKVFSFCAGLALFPMIAAGIVLDSLPYPLMEQVAEMLACTLLLAFFHNHYRKNIEPILENGGATNHNRSA